MDLVFSDIHADISALESILNITKSPEFTKKYGKFSRIINLGDLLERGTNPKQVLRKLTELSKSYPIKSVMGNHDEAFLYKRNVSGSSIESLSAHYSLSKKDLEFFKENKDKTFGAQEFLDKKNGLVCVHGGPIDPKKIAPKDSQDAWLYQKTWQRLSEDEEFFSYYGYHYLASSAFAETKSKVDNPIILCGHQHMEAAIKHNKKGTSEILSKTKIQKKKMSDFLVETKEIPIRDNSSYLIRVGLGGPQGYYGTGEARPHFAIIQDNPKKVILFAIEKWR